ncbi:hypothetical protein CA13_13560 [Planctomycetes bacterium CA13]|uniref:VWFA domain-containing protein n=2 Tax=Novipirellula herctigrandis TaxID=2527986 RepID=A0A5C5YY01_9BACT|nr:hypothetical protein CA13_13560 [Planctomycetes bacterium CA13]
MIATLRFAGDLPVWLVVAGALLATIAVMVYYLRETRSLAAPYSYLLPALRAAAVAMVLLILAGPIWHSRRVVGTLGKVVFAIDTSESMAVTDSASVDASESRVRRAARLLSGQGEFAGLVESLRSSHEIEVVAFDGNASTPIWTSRNEQPLGSLVDVAASGARTNLSAPLLQQKHGVASGEVDANDTVEADTSDELVGRSAVVILSDGRHNFGPSPVNSAEQLASNRMQVLTVGMGSEDEPDDVGIAEMVRPDSVAADGQLSGRMVLKQFGMSGKPVGVRIEHLGQTVWRQTVTPESDGEMDVPFTFDVEPLVKATRSETERGVSRDAVALDLKAVVDGPESESTIPGMIQPLAKNDSMPFRVAAATRDRRLLILDGSSRWETRYIRNLFDRDPAWRVDTILFGPGTDTATVLRGEQPGQMPNSIEAISVYDAIILGEIPPDQFGDSDASVLTQFVSRGGGLIVVDGRYGNVGQLADERLAELIPVEYPRGNQPVASNQLIPTGIGMEHPVLNISHSDSDPLAIWRDLPPPQYAAIVKPQAGAEVWANTILGDQTVSPWLVTRLFGAGRVFYIASDQTWRWRYKVADELHSRFWNQLLSAAMQPPYSASDAFVAIGTDKVEYEPGESSVIRVRLQDPSGKPIGDAVVDALLVSNDQVVAAVPLGVDNPSRGTFQGATLPLEPGQYKIRIRASGFDSTALQATTPIWVGSADRFEWSRVGLDRDAMVQIAQRGGGEYFHESAADELLESLKPLSSGVVVESDILVWQSFYWFWLIIIVLAVEWLLRKRAGLV